jgi:hypothetical protein
VSPTTIENRHVDAVSVVAFAYDIYTNPSKNNGGLHATLTKDESYCQTFG